MTFFRKLVFQLFYLRKPPWDTGISPPELMAFIDSHPPGRALDLGCGTGTNVITLAQHGWQATGVDFVGRAIQTARRKARLAGVSADVRQGDVTRLEGINGPFDLILDLGCFHSLTEDGMQRYVHNLDRLLAKDGTYLMYCFVKPAGAGGVGLTEDELKLFDGVLKLQNRQNGFDRGERTSAWFTYSR